MDIRESNIHKVIERLRSIEHRLMRQEIVSAYQRITAKYLIGVREQLDWTDEFELEDRPRKRRNEKPHPDSRFVALSEAARISGFHRDTLKGYAQAGEIVYSLHNRRWFLDRKSLNSFLDRISVKPAARRGRPGRPRLISKD